MENELKKCLLCKNPLCLACPAGTAIPAVIKLVREGKVDKAGELLFDNNPLTAITGAVCPNHLFCHGSCILSKKGNAVNFGKIEKDISEKYISSNPKIQCSTPNGKKALIVGSGPAGLTIAYYLRKNGFAVEVHEKQPLLGGMLRYGIPSFRLDKTLIDKTTNVLSNMGIDFKKNSSVDLQNLPSGFDVTVLAIGAGLSKKLDIEGTNHAVGALDYLKYPSPATNPLIIGGGNVAIDCALTAADQNPNATVTLCYRRNFEDMKAYPEEIELAIKNKINLEFRMVPKQITPTGALFVKDEKEIFMPADKIIIAVGQTVDPYNANQKNIYTIGDATTGTSTIIQAVASAKKLASKLLG